MFYSVDNCALGTFNWGSSDIRYCDMVVNNCRYLFGCCNIKKAEFCILNKQYKEKEYFELQEQIIEHMKRTKEWGEFFPIQDSIWAYNETVANDFFPLSKKEALWRGYKWLDEEKMKIGSGDKVPDDIASVENSILEKTFVCENSGRPYKIIEPELKFYKKMIIPVPHLAPETKNILRFNSRNLRKIWERKCDKCGVEIKTSYPPAGEKGHYASLHVYCEKCYLESLS